MKPSRSISIILVASLILAFYPYQGYPATEDRPSGSAMMIDIPVRVLSLGLTLFSATLFVVALPFTLASDSTGDAWEALVVEPYEFTFTRPLGQFDEWRHKESNPGVNDKDSD